MYAQKAAILSIGTELTRGELINTNAAWLGEELSTLGFEVTEHRTIDDDLGRIQKQLLELCQDHAVILCTGGLGPTTDDLTAEAAALAAKVPLVRNEREVQIIRDKWASRRSDIMPVSNEKQANFPEGATVLSNPKGTASGFGLHIEQTQCFFLPGVPREMKPMFLTEVVPTIAPLIPEKRFVQHHLRTFGLTESKVNEKLQGIEASFPGVTIGYRASFPEIEVKVFSGSDTITEAENQAQQAVEEVSRRLGKVIYGGKDDTFASSVGRSFRDQGKTLAVAESCTGGLVGSMLTDVPGASEYLLLDAVVYSNRAKTKLLKVPEETLRAHGAVSEEVAALMAEGALRCVDADVAISITGIAGPGGGTDEKPVGTVWFGCAQRNGKTQTKKHFFPYDRFRIRKLSAYVALQIAKDTL